MGFLADLWELGEDRIRAEARGRLQSLGTSAHIQAQNEVIQDFEREALTPYRRGQLSAAGAVQRIRELDAAFSTFANELGYGRAIRGAADVNALAARLIQDVSSPGPGVLPDIPSWLDAKTVLLGLGLGYLLLKPSPKRRRRR